LPHFFTDRNSGSSVGAYESLNLAFHVGDLAESVVVNRAVLGPVQFMNQMHGDEVVVIDSALAQDPTCDALITTTHGLALAVMVADCIPLLLVSNEAVAAVHVGRAGLLNRIAIKTIQKMRSLGAIEVHAILGPSICGKCYEVPFDLQQEVVTNFPKAFSTTRKGTPGLDLPAALIADLIEFGVGFKSSTICTMESDLYFSHRRHNPTGRFAGVVSL